MQPNPLAQAQLSQLSPSPPPFMHFGCGGDGGGVGGTWVRMQFKGCSKRQARSQKVAEHSSWTPAALWTHTNMSHSVVSVAAVAGQACLVRPKALRVQNQSLLRSEVCHGSMQAAPSALRGPPRSGEQGWPRTR